MCSFYKEVSPAQTRWRYVLIRVRFQGGGGVLEFRGASTIRQGPFESKGGKVTFLQRAGRLEISDRTETLWLATEEGSVDTLRVHADRLEAELEGRRVRRMTFVGSVGIAMTVVRNGSRATRLIEADSCVVTLHEKGAIERLQAAGDVRIDVRSAEGAATELSGRRADISLREGDLNRVRVDSSATLRHLGEDGSSSSSLSGDRVQILFLGGSLHRVLVEGQAVCEYVLMGDSERDGVFLTGDSVELEFEDCELIRALSSGGVQGRYRPPEEKAP
jgi:hypothetical protein